MGPMRADPGVLLHWAARRNRTDLVREALSMGEPIDAVVSIVAEPNWGKRDQHPEGEANEGLQGDGDHRKIPDDVEKGADLETIKETALHAAVRCEAVDVVRALLAAGADLTIKDYCDKTSVTRAAERGGSVLDAFVAELCQRAGKNDVDGVNRLIAAGLPVDSVDGSETQNCALHWAATFGSVDAMKTLIDYGANLNPQNKDGVTPLMDSARHGHVDCVSLLLSTGADPLIMGRNKEMALDLAISEEIRGLLEPETHGQAKSAIHTDNDVTGESQSATLLRALDEQLDQLIDLSSELPPWASCLWPRPRRINLERTSCFICPSTIQVVVSAKHASIARTFASWIRGISYVEKVSIQIGGGVESRNGSHIRLTVDNGASLGVNTEAYRIYISKQAIDLVASDAAGMFYGCCTLEQLLRMRSEAAEHPREQSREIDLPCGSIVDWPTLHKRAFMMDISQYRVPHVHTIKRVVEILARFKYNQLQLKMGSSFAFVGSEEIRPHGDVLTPEDLIVIDRICQDNFIELVPHLESMGNFNDWFQRAHYRDLAECPDRVEDALEKNEVTQKIEHLSLCATDPEVVDSLLSNLYSQFFPCFSSEQVHVGLDDTQDIGEGRSGKRAPREDLLFGFLDRLSHLAASLSKPTLQFWSDSISLTDIELSSGKWPTLTVAVERGFDEGYPFSHRCALLARRGIPFYTCPSTQTHNSIGGRLSSSIDTIKNAAKASMRHGGVGMIVADWGDNGHLNTLVTAFPPLIVGAGAAWNVPEALSSNDSDVELVCRLLDCHIFRDGDVGGVLGSVLCMFGDVHLVAEGKEPGLHRQEEVSSTSDRSSSTRLFNLLVYRNDKPSSEGLNTTGLRRAQRRVEKALDILNTYRGKADTVDTMEMQLVGELLRITCRIGVSLNPSLTNSNGGESVALHEISGLTRSDVVNRFVQVLYLYRICWDARCKAGSFQRSVQYLERPLMELASELPYMPGFVEEKSRLGWKGPEPV